MNKYFLVLVITVIISSSSFNCFAAQKTIENKYQEIEMEQDMSPEYLYKIVSKEQWQASASENDVILSPMDKDFIHFATEDQLPHVAKKFWNNMDYIVLKVTSDKLIGRLVYETNPGGTTKYYHLYEGRIPLEAVRDVIAINRSQ